MLPDIPGTYVVRGTRRYSRYGRWLRRLQKSMKNEGCYLKGYEALYARGLALYCVVYTIPIAA